MTLKQYTTTVRKIAARPRSKRLREAGVMMSSTTLDVVGGGQGDCFFEEYQEPDGTVSVRLKKRYSGLWTDGFLASLGRRAAEEDSGGSALLFEPLASINEASLDMPQEAGVGIVWNGRRWEYGRTGGGFSTISKVSEGVLRWSDSNGGEGVAVNFIHTHAFADITGKPTTLAGYGITDAYTMTQVDALLAQKVDVSWFRSLFRAYASGGSEILPNASGTIDNIQSMLGFWTNQYISALGRGSAGSTLLDETMLWSLLGNSDTTKQISLSHLQAALSSYAQTANVITRVAKNPDGDGRIDFVSQSQTVTVDFIHTHSWAQITGQPTKLSQFQNDVPYATAAELTSALSQLSYYDTVSRVSDGILRWGGRNAQTDVNFIHTHAFADITGKPTTLAGYGITDAYTMTQVDALLAQKVDVSWFRSLFRAYASGGSEILPNASGTIDNIQSMLGFWTNQYISALGRGSAGSTLLDETMLWSLLGNSDTTKQISLSHLQAALSSYAQTANVITRVAKNPDGDGRIDFVSQSQTVTVDFIHTHSWAQITGQPTKLSQFQNDVPYATAAELSSTVSTAIAALSFYNSASWNSTSLKLTLSGQNASKEVTLSHSHDVYLGTTKLTTGNASGSVTAVTGLGTINTDALVLRQITYNSATVNAVGIGGTPSYPLDVSGLARFRSGIKLSASGANAVLDISNSNMTFSGNGYVTQYIRKGTAYLALSSSGSGEYGLVVYNTNEVRFSAGAWSDTYLSALGQNTSSDRRLKTELGKVSLKVSDIAAAPMVRYLWTGKPWLGEQVGSYAQAWQPLLPEAVKNGHDGYLEMQYGVIALLSVIATAREVEDHGRRILELEGENRILKEEMERLKQNS